MISIVTSHQILPPLPAAELTIVSPDKLYSPEGLPFPRALPWRSANREEPAETATDLPDAHVTFLKRNRDQPPPVRREVYRRNRNVVRLEDVQPRRGFEVVHDHRAFVCAHGESLGTTVEIYGRETAVSFALATHAKAHAKTSSLRMTVAASHTSSRIFPIFGSRLLTTLSQILGRPFCITLGFFRAMNTHSFMMLVRPSAVFASRMSMDNVDMNSPGNWSAIRKTARRA